MAARYKTLFKEMERDNAELCQEFKDISEKYDSDPKKYSAEFNEVGERFSALVVKYIDDLCRTSEASHGSNALKLPDLFKDQVRQKYPDYDDIGVIVE